MDTLSSRLRTALERELDDGEVVLWCGRPDAERVRRRSWRPALPGIVLFVMLCVIPCVTAFSMWQELRGVDPILGSSESRNPPTYSAVVIMSCFGVLMLGCAVLFARWPSREAAKARRRIYAVTPTRVLLIDTDSSGDGLKTVSLEPGHPLMIERVEIENGRGDLAIHANALRHQGLMQFHGIDDARGVERLIRATFDPPDRR